jgi:hypothetical protein
MLCRSCGKWIPDNFTFCNYCGSQVVPANPAVPQTPLPTPSSLQQAWQSTPPPTPQQPGPSTPSSPRLLRHFAQTSPQQPIASWERGIQQTTGNPANPPATHPTNSGSTFSYGTNPLWQDHQSEQASVPEHLSPQTVSSPLSQQQPAWSQPFQPSQQQLAWSQPFQPSQQQPFPQDQLRAQASTGESSVTPNRVQHLLIQLFQPSLAANPWLGIIIGGISPALLGALFFIILSAIQHPSSSSASDLNALNTLASSLTGVIPTDSAVRDGLQALLTAQGVGRHIVGNYSATAGNILLNVDLASPLQIMLLIPALFLVMGGYLAACTDMQNRTVASLWRGAAISLPYMLLLLMLSTQANGDIASSLLPHTSSNSALSFLQGQVSFTLSMNVASLIILSLFWGTLFGLLGASLKLARGHWRHWLHNLLRSNTQSRLTAIVAGGLLAVLLGFLFSLLFTYVAMVSNLQFMQGSTCGSGAASATSSSLTASNMAAGPFIAVQLFAFSFGTPISLNVHASGMSAITNALSKSSCLQQTSFSLFGGMAHSSPWMYLLLFLPAIALFSGGRVSAHFGRPASPGVAAIQGALIAIPFTIAMMILAALSMFSLSMEITGTVIILGNIPDTQVVVSLGAGVIDVMVWSLLIGAFLGALGGIYQASAMSRELDFALARLGRGLTLLAGPGYKLIDQLDTRRPATRMRGRTLNILGAALWITLLLTLVSVASGLLLISFSSVVTYDLNHRLHSIMSALLIALPGLLLLCTFISALFDDPQDAPETRGMNRMNLR